MTIRSFFITICFLLLSLSFSHAQNLGFDWSAHLQQIGLNKDDIPRHIKYDSQGNIIIVGFFRNTVDFDPGPAIFSLSTYSVGVTDIFILKLTATGNFIWAKKIGSAYTDDFAEFCIDSGDNIYISGQLNHQNTDMDPGPGTYLLSPASSTDNLYVVKLNSGGNFLWAVKTGNSSTSSIYPLGMAMDSFENLIITGRFGGTVDFDPGVGTATLVINNANTYGSYVLKLNNAGEFLAVKQFTSSGLNTLANVAVDSQNNILIAGSFHNTMDFDPGSGVYNMTPLCPGNAFLLRLNSNLEFISAFQIGNQNVAAIKDIDIGSDNAYYVIGTFSETFDFDPGPGVFNLSTPQYYNHTFLAKYSASGQLVWAKTVLTSGQVKDLTVDNNQNVYYTGFLSGTADFDPGSPQVLLNTTGPSDLGVFLVKLNSSGDFVMASALNGQGNETGHVLLKDNNGHLMLAGTFTDQIDTDPGTGTTLYSTNSVEQTTDVFIARYVECLNSSVITTSACGSYQLNNTTYNQSGTYTQYISGTTLCDSNVILNLTILPQDTTVLQEASCQPVTINGQIYSQSGTYYQELTAASGCDSVVKIQFQLLFPASTQNSTSCGAYTLNGTTYSQSGTYTQTLVSAQGCDSTLTLNLIVNQPTASVQTITACESYLFDGQELTASGTYTGIFENASGCDSTVTLNLIINQSASSVQNISACGSYEFDGEELSASGTYTATYQNTNGCDSLVTLNLTIIESTFSELTFYSQEGITLNGVTYSVSGTYEQLLENANGCDSTLTIHLTILDPQTLDVYTLPDIDENCNGSAIINASGTPQFTLELDGNTFTSASGQFIVPDLCEGLYPVLVTDGNGNTTDQLVVISAQQNYIYNDQSADSIAVDSLGVTIEFCDYEMDQIDSVTMESYSVSGNVATLNWKVYSGNNFSTIPVSYILTQGDGMYNLQLSLYCPTKSSSQHSFTVTSRIYFQSYLGITENETAAVTIFPNPSSDFFSVRSETNPDDVYLTDIFGNTVKRYDDQTAVFSLKDLAAGTYMVVVKIEGREVVRKITKL